jgi:hypothetical protein
MIAGAKLGSIFKSEAPMKITRNILYLLIGALGIGAGAFAYWLYQEQHKSGVEINIGPRGVTIEEK